jgi:uncharacterized protein (DUF697 family)
VLKRVENYIDKLTENLDKDSEHKDDPVKSIISKYAAICAVTAMLPHSLIPGSDFVALTTIQCIMARNIAKHYGINPSFDELKELVTSLGMTLGLAFAAQQLVLSAYRTFIPYWGGVTTFGMVFSATYAIGYVIDRVYSSRVNGEDFCPENMKSILNDLKEEGKNLSKKYNPKKLKEIALKAWEDSKSNSKDKAA